MRTIYRALVDIPALRVRAGDLVILAVDTASVWRPVSRCLVMQNLSRLELLGHRAPPDHPPPPDLKVIR